MIMNKTRFLAAVSVATLSTTAWAQLGSFNYSDKDLVAVFTKAGSDDFAVDLGPASSFQNGSNVDFTSKYSVSALLATYGGSLSGVNWTVFGGASPSTPHNIWISIDQPNTTPLGFKASTATSDASIAKNNGAGLNAISGEGTAVLNTATSLRYTRSDALYANDGFSALNIPGDATHSGVYGYTSQQEYNVLGAKSDLYQFIAGTGNSRGAVSILGPLELENNGHLVFNPVVVPEPQDYAVIAGGALVAGAMLRRRFQSR
jgi:hypothetical protein